MKTLKRIVLVLAATVLVAASTSPPAKADVSFGFFYSELEPHGSWMVSASYGRVWQPSVYAAGWNPYYDGEWVHTNLGWTWASDYHWGAIPYHYGTWVLDPVYGWVWVPGYVWAPAWVVFRTGPDYIGWCPVRPDFSVGASFGFSDYDSSLFVFVPARHFVAERVRTYVVPRTEVTVIYKRTNIVRNSLTVENDVVVNRGPDVKWIEKAAGRKVERVSIEQVKGVAPGGRFSREAVRIDPQKAKKGLRAAEPIPKDAPLPLARASGKGELERPKGGAGRREAFKERKLPAAERVPEGGGASFGKREGRAPAPSYERARSPKSRPERESLSVAPRQGSAEGRVRASKEAMPAGPRMSAKKSTPRESATAKAPERATERQRAKAMEPEKEPARKREREKGKKTQESRSQEERGKGKEPSF